MTEQMPVGCEGHWGRRTVSPGAVRSMRPALIKPLTPGTSPNRTLLRKRKEARATSTGLAMATAGQVESPQPGGIHLVDIPVRGWGENPDR